jgi:hypothetical protein
LSGIGVSRLRMKFTIFCSSPRGATLALGNVGE